MFLKFFVESKKYNIVGFSTCENITHKIKVTKEGKTKGPIWW